MDAVAALRAGEAVLLPTDTVYGLCADAYRAEPARRLNTLKGRPPGQPLALIAADLELLLESLPELRGREESIARSLLPGPVTIIFPNPARRLSWLSGDRAETLGVRVPVLPPQTKAVLDAVGAVAATSANLTGGSDPRRLDEVPEELRRACGAELDAGELPGTPSTIVDVTGPEPVVLREGALAAADVLARLSG